jgi:hypothetical protein
MRRPKPNTVPVTKTSLDEEHAVITVLFNSTSRAWFSLYQVPESGQECRLLMEVSGGSQPLHCQLLNETQIWPGARLAYLVHELGLADGEREGEVIIYLLGYSGLLPNGYIAIDIPRNQAVTGYIDFVDEVEDEDDDEAEVEPESGSARRAKAKAKAKVEAEDDEEL